MKGKKPRTERKRRRRHTNTKGRRQIKRGKPHRQMQALARRLGIPYGVEENKDVRDTDDNL